MKNQAAADPANDSFFKLKFKQNDDDFGGMAAQSVKQRQPKPAQSPSRPSSARQHSSMKQAHSRAAPQPIRSNSVERLPL